MIKIPTPTSMLFLDIDGTLLDHAGAVDRALRQFHAQVPELQAVPVKQFAQAWQQATNFFLPQFYTGRMDVQTLRLARLRKVFAMCAAPLEEQRIEHIYARYARWYEQGWRWFPEVPEVLERLRGQRLGIITNGYGPQQLRKLDFLKLAGWADPVVTFTDVMAAKPRPEIFCEACQRADVSPDQAVYVGDEWETDALGAQSAGMHPIWLNRSGAPVPDTAIASINSLAELPGRLATQ